MRRFEYVGGGSEKFWEIDGAGAEVTVRFGRLGTNGQTQTKDLQTAAAATAHMAKLVAEKTKKGYIEVTSPSAAIYRWRMPVRCTIHSSDVSTLAASS